MANALIPRQTPTPTTGGDSTEQQLLKLVSNPFQSSFQYNAFWASFGTSLVISVILALIFSFVRPHHLLVYAPKIKHADEKHAPPPIDKGFWSWIGPVRRAKEPFLVDKIGLDAVLFLRFTRMLRNIFAILGVIGLLVMIPVNVADRASGIPGGSAFTIMTPLNVFGNGLWAQVVCAWVFDVIVVYFLWHNYRRVLSLRRTYFQSPEYQQSLHARTLLIRDIPNNVRSDEGLLRITEGVNPLGILPKTTVGRNVRVLPDLIEEHEECVKKLESVLAKYLRNPDSLPAARPMVRAPRTYKGDKVGGKVDAIEYLTQRIRELEEQIRDVRDRVDKRDAMSYGFASWEQIDQAHVVAYTARKKHPQGASIRLAPRPNDIIWKNLALSKGTRRGKKLWNIFGIAVLTVIWTPLNAAIAIFLSNLSNLGSVWPAFQTQLERHKTWWALVQGIASPAITSLVYLILPTIFRRLQIRAGDDTKTAREHHVLRNLYVFFTLNNLIVFSLFSAFWNYITFVVQANSVSVWQALKAGQFFLTVTMSLCQISPFWVIWLLQRNLGATLDLAQLWTLFYVWFRRTFMSPTPRQNIEWTAPPAFDYASYYNYFLFYATIGFCFSTLQPIVLIITALYFTIDSFLKKYLLMYVFITKTESGGVFWRTLYNRLLFALVLSNIVIGVVVKARGTWTMVACLAPLLFLVAGFKWYCSRTFDDEIYYYAKSAMRDQEALAPKGRPKSMAMIASKFGHPALYKPLMTPMVHAKARHVLAQVYRGRLNSEGFKSNAFSDIALEPMGQTGKPVEDAPFEIVPEAQQDFAFYKNRTDFREEGGELYGKPEDLISERSRTPKSFMGPEYRDNWSPASSRPGTPGPESSPPALRKDAHIKRKAFHSANVHPALGSGYSTREHSLERPESEVGDIGIKHGQYDGFDDTTNLLGNPGDLPTSTPRGEFMDGIDSSRWHATTPRATSGYRGIGRHEVGEEEMDTTSYDYFRSVPGRR